MVSVTIGHPMGIPRPSLHILTADGRPEADGKANDHIPIIGHLPFIQSISYPWIKRALFQGRHP